ncbi:heme-binding protein [bacterium]|jgi:hypothetical protein|nr:heme-binding protein [bacterium]
MKYLLIGIVVLLLSWLGVTYWFSGNIESPNYAVLLKKKHFELRRYDSFIVAEVSVEGDYKSSINQGFRILAGYIFGGNLANQSIKMTAPVTETSSEKIKMTAPVTETTDGKSHLINFTMPRKYTLETLPVPQDKSINFRLLPTRNIAATSFTWYASPKRVKAKKESLSKRVKEAGFKIKGEPTYAGFTAPFSFPLLMKHEIWIEVED